MFLLDQATGTMVKRAPSTTKKKQTATIRSKTIAKKGKTNKKKRNQVKATNDLNARFSPPVQQVRRSPHAFRSGEVWFDGIEGHIMARLQDQRNVFALVASPWLSSQSILKSLASCMAGVAVLTNLDKSTRSGIRTKAFKSLPSIEGYARVRYTGAGSGRQRSHPHQKFIALLDANKQPREVIVGSYNLSGGSETSLETMVLLQDAEAASHYVAEFNRISKIARVLHP